MNNLKPVIIGLVVALAAAIGYAVYLHQGPIKNTSTENQNLLDEIDQMKMASKNLNSDHQSELDNRTQRVKELESKSKALEKTVARISEEKKLVETELGKSVSQVRKEKETIEAELRGTIEKLEQQLAQRERELQESRSESQQLKAASAETTVAHKADLATKIRLVEELQKKSNELEQTISRIKKETETLAADLQATITGLENQLAQWDGELQTSRQEVQKLRSTLTSLESSTETLRQSLADNNRQLLAAGEQIKGLRKETEERQAQLSQAKIANKALIEQNDSLKTERDQLKQSQLELKNKLIESQNRFQATSDDLAAKDQTLSEMEAGRQQLLSQVTALDNEKEELARLKDALKNQLGMTQSQIETLSMDAAAKEKQLKSKEQQLMSMEKAYQELSKQFELQITEKEIKISTLENKLNIRLMDKILFASGSADITSDGNGVLESLATELQKMDGFEISVAGHTDNMGIGPKIKDVYKDNMGLSVARAASVSRKLSEMGVSPANLSATGYSMYRPLTSNETKEGRQRNRRVEIMLEPLREN